MVQLPIFDDDGYPVQKRGITDCPGLYFVGLPWLHSAKSVLLFGVGQDAAYIASAIDREASRRPPTSRVKAIACGEPDRCRFEHNLEVAKTVALLTAGRSGIGGTTKAAEWHDEPLHFNDGLK